MSSNVVMTPEHLDRVVQYFGEQDAFVFDVESMDGDAPDTRGVAHLNDVRWISLATHGQACVIPMGHPNGNRLISKAYRKKNAVTKKMDLFPPVFDAPPEQMSPSYVFKKLEPLFFNEDQVKVAHNAVFDIISIVKYYGGDVPYPDYSDTQVLQWLVDDNNKTFGLKDLVKKHYKVDYDQENVGKRIEDFAFKKVAHYGYMDAKYTWLLYQRLLQRIKTEKLENVMLLENDVTAVLVDMRLQGAKLDMKSLTELHSELAEQMVYLEGNIYAAARKNFNINSVPQKVQILFGDKEKGGQGLIPKKMTPNNNPSTDAEALEPHARNPVVKALLEYQEVARLQTGYVEAYLGNEDEGGKKKAKVFGGKLYADFVQHGTTTGRFSCRAPNLQNIPRPDTELGKKVRGLFIPPAGYKMIVADYGQIELVVMAHFSRDKNLVDGFRAGIDAHTATAAAVFSVEPSKVTKEMRQVAKGLNFAIVFGAGPDKVASMANVKIGEAKKFLEIHQRQFKNIYTFKKDVVKTCRTRKPPHVRTLLGRKRRLPTINSSNQGLRGYAERQAVNSVVQGSAADITKLAMVRLNASLPEDMHLILTVHDELVTLVPDNEEKIAQGTELVREAMTGKGIGDIMILTPTIDLKVVDRWAEAK